MTDNVCVCCGTPIPEGRQVCLSCDSVKHADRVVVDALKKATPKMPIGDLNSVPHFRCPTCDRSVKTYADSPEMPYCGWCGQALLWK